MTDATPPTADAPPPEAAAPPPEAAAAPPRATISEELAERLLRSGAPIRPHVVAEGLARTHPAVTAADLAAVAGAGTFREAIDALAACRARWVGIGVARSVDFAFEPVADGAETDVVVRLSVAEAPSRQEIGVFTTETAAPEVKASVRNALGRAFELSAHYMPSSTKAQSGALTLVSHTPWLGRRCTYLLGRRSENSLSGTRPVPVADAEHVTEATVTLDSGDHGVTPWFASAAVGMQRRLLAAADAHTLPAAEAAEYGASRKAFARGVVRHSAPQYHAHPRLRSMYGLPVGGHVALASAEVAAPVLGADASHAKVEAAATKFVALLPGVTLDVSATAGAVFPLATFLGDSWRSPRAAETDAAGGLLTAGGVRLPDRLFLSWRHVRGFRSVGPDNVAAAAERGGRVPKKFRALGGNAMWAAAATLNFPLPLFPENGFVAGHLFANVGNLVAVPSPAKLAEKAAELFSRPTASVGAGVVVTSLPMFSPTAAGRFELNWSLPITVGPDGAPRVGAANEHLFSAFRWGLHWTSSTN